MLWLESLVLIITVLNIGLAGVVIFLEKRNVAATWAWLMVLLFLPVVGFIVYLIFGQRLGYRKVYKLNEQTQRSLRKAIQDQQELFQKQRLSFHDETMERYSDLMYMNLMSSSAVFTQNNKVDIYTNGVEKFAALIESIRRAKESIHLVYYIVRDDEIGNLLVDELAKKAREGVQVRFLYDQIGCYRLPKGFFRRLTDAGGYTAIFLPSHIPYLNFRVNYRNHRKMVIIDGTEGYIGGINVGDEYLGRNPKFGYWRDTHLRIRGEAVLQMQALFLLDWNLASQNHKVISEEPYYPPQTDAFGQIGVQIVASGPHEPIEHIRNVYVKMIHSAKKSIYIQTPYFIPDESVWTALQLAVMSGVDVRLMIPGKPDHKMVYWASYSYLGELLEMGMKCYLYDKGFLHSKMIIVDGLISSVGTANFDIRSFRLNMEVNAVLYDSQTAGKLKSIFEEDLKECRELTFEAYQARPKREKIRESLIRLLSPIL